MIKDRNTAYFLQSVLNLSIGLLSFAMVGDRERILAAGATGYIEKPIAPGTFAGEIRKYLGDIS